VGRVDTEQRGADSLSPEKGLVGKEPGPDEPSCLNWCLLPACDTLVLSTRV
jgi:hypothetical protein